MAGAGMYGAMLVGAFVVAAVRSPIASKERRKVLVLVHQVRRMPGAQASLTGVLVIVAAGSLALAANPSAGQAFADTDKATIVYIEGSTPMYREWIPSAGGGGSWSNAVSLTAADTTLDTVKIEFSPVSSKRVIVTMDANGALDSYVCYSGCTDTANWTFANNFADVSTGTVTASYRPWDIEYEHTSGDLIIVYDYTESGSSATDDLFYRMMTDSQTSFGSESSINDAGTTATDARYSFVAMDSQKTSGSDEMALIALEYSDQDASAIVWNGSDWTTLPQTELSIGVGIANEEVVAIAYETNSGDILIVAGEGASIRHNTFSNASNTWGTSSISTGTWAVGTLNWLRLVPDPRSTSDAILLGGVGNASDLDSAYWSGTAWTDHGEHDGGITGNDKRYFDFTWDGESSNGVLAWSTADRVITFTRGDPSSGLFGGTDGTFSVDNDRIASQWIRLVPNPTTTDTVAALGLEIDENNDIGGIQWDGGSNNPASTGIDGITLLSTNTTWEPFDIDFQKVPTKRSMADSLSAIDSLAKLFNANRSASESLAVADSAARLAILARSNAESLGVFDSLARMLAATRSASDSLGVADLSSRSLHALRSASETLAVTDSTSRAVSLARSISSSLAVTDLPSKRKLASRSASDSLAVSDLPTYTRHVTRLPFTGLGITDDVTVTKAVSKQLSDSLGVADSIDATLAASRAVADGMTVTDEASRSFSTSRSVSDSLAATAGLDVSRSVARSLSDSISTSDAVSAARLVQVSISDTLAVSDLPTYTRHITRQPFTGLGISDDLAVSKSLTKSIGDTLATSDSMARMYDAERSTADSVSVSDDVAIRLMRAVSDSLSLDDTLSVSLFRPVSESLAVSDSLSTSITRSLSDSVAVADSTSRSADMSRQVSDGLVIDDITRLAFTRNISDSLLASDSASALKVFGRVIGDSLGVAESIGRSIISSIDVSDDLSVSESLGREFVGSRSLADSLSIADSIDVAKTYNRQAAESLAVADSLSKSLVSSREAAEPLAVSDAITTGLVASRQVSDSLAVSDAVVAGKFIGIGISDALGIADAAAPATIFARSLDDALVVTEEIFRPPIFNERITIDDSISVSHTRSLSDSLQVSDEIRAPRFVAINDSLGVTSSMYVAWSGTLQFNESFALGDGLCLPSSCIHNLALGESLGMQDAWVGPPRPQDTVAVTDSVSVVVTGAGPTPADGVSVTDRATTSLELVPPAVPTGWGLTEMPGVIIAGNGTSIELPAAPLLPGTYEASGGVEAMVQDTGMPTYDVDSALAGADMSDQTLVIPMFRVSMNPSADLPSHSGLLSPVMSSIPANTRVSVPVNVNATVADLGVNHPVNWIDLNYTPAVGVTDFTLLVSMLDSEPEGAQEIPDDMARFYLDVRWTGTFAGAERPSDPSFYAVAPTFSFGITEEWAAEQRMVRDSNGVPIFSLSLLNEATGEWEDVTDIDSPAGAVNGLYEYVAHLEHFSTYAVTAETRSIGRGGGGEPVERFEADLEESLQVSEQLRVLPIEVIEEPGAREFTVRLADSLAILTQQAAVKTFTVRDMVDVTVTIQSVERTSIFPPQVTATFRVDVVNRGQEHEAFDLLFSYFDQSGKEAYSSSRLVEVGPLERTQFALEIQFDSPGTFQVNIEARSIPEGKLLSTSQQLVEVPWLEVNLYLLVMAIIAVLGGTAAALALFGPKYFTGRPGQQVFSLTSDNKKHGRAGKQNPIRYFFGKRRPEGRQSD